MNVILTFLTFKNHFKLISVSPFKQEQNIHFRYLVYINNRILL